MMATIAVTIPSGRLKSPYTGIPVPGERPLVVSTERLRLALHGVTVQDAAVIDTVKAQTSGETGYRAGIGDKVRALEVVFSHGRKGRGRVVLYDIAYSKDAGKHKLNQAMIAKDIREWAESHRVRKSKQAIGGGNGSARAQRAGVAIRRLEKEKKALYLPGHPPLHPLLRSKCDYDYRGKDHYRKLEWRWHNERYHRKQLASVAGKVLQRKITGTTGYKLLREMGYTVKTYSELRTHERERRPSQDEYWRHLPEFCGYLGEAGRPEDYSTRLDDEGLDQYQRHARARVEYLADRRTAESLDIQIAEFKRMALEGC